MRPDMKQVLIERPRRGGHGARRPGKPRYQSVESCEDVPTRESVHRWYGWDNKEQSDSFNPLYGFLRSRVGQPWDQVWKEICEHNHDHMGLHLRRHMKDIIEVNTQMGPDGQVLDSKGSPLVGWRWGGQFYVHPKTRLLCEQPERKRNYRRSSPQKTIIELDGRKYHRHNGIWYRVETAPAPETPNIQKSWDYTQKYPWRNISYQPYPINSDACGNGGSLNSLVKAYGEPVYCVSKQQAGKKECRKLNKLSGIV